MSSTFFPVPLDDLVAEIHDGALLAMPADYSGAPMAATRALIRRGVKDLRLVTVPQSTLQAAEKDVPFIPLRGILGSDLVKHRSDWKTVDNPMAASGDPILLIPAIRPDVALFHAPMADREGNIWIGRRRELATIAHASKTTLVTVERMYEGSFFDDEKLAAGALPAFYVTSVAIAERGAAPVGLFGEYEADIDHLRAYAREARTEAGFQAYLAREVGTAKAAA